MKPSPSFHLFFEGIETELESQRRDGSLDLVSSFKEPLLQIGSDHEQDRWSTDVNYDLEKEKQVEDTEEDEEEYVEERMMEKEAVEKLSIETTKQSQFDSEDEEEAQTQDPEGEYQDFMKGFQFEYEYEEEEKSKN